MQFLVVLYILPSMQTLYAQVQVSKIGSLSYAEDDGSHVIGFKVADPFDADSYACHVVECSSEVCGPMLPGTGTFC